jgi:hypothetical protein
VISDPDPEGYVLIVGLTTWNDNRFDDPTCILNIEDGIEFIKHRSYIRYSSAMDMNSVELLNEKHKEKIIYKGVIPYSLLECIQQGARESTRLPVKFRKYFSYF